MGKIFDTDGIYMLLRWFHFLAGITWIGLLYYFNLVQTPFFKNADAAVRSGMVRGLVPSALWWFRWGAMFTLLTGWIYMLMFVSKSELPWSSPYPTLILSGGLLGTLMWANVWFVIWPCQKVVIASAEQVAKGGQALPEAAAKGALAGMASRTNFVLSIPMLFFMGSASHLAAIVDPLGGKTGWWIAFLVVVAAVEWNALKGNEATRKPLTTVKGAITFGFVLWVVFYAAVCLLAGA
jgi:uncharacterized membrane protein